MKRAAIIEGFNNRRALRAEIKDLRRKREIIETEIRDKEFLLDYVQRTDKVVDGVPLEIDGASIEDASGQITRWTRHYENVRDGGTGLYFNEWNVEYGGYKTIATIISQPYRIARKRALAWVLKGELPEGIIRYG